MKHLAKILLLQARNPGDPARAEEVRSFAARCGVDASQITPWSLLDGPPSMAEIRFHDTLMVGGSGEYYVSKGDLPHFPLLQDRLLEVVEAGHPTFASCFGFQCLVVALGGEIVHDADNMEVGTYEITLSGDGRRDELFSHLPPTFNAQLGRKDRAAGPWDGMLALASSERCPVQALRIPGKPIWASQFHPELDRDTNLFRFNRYLEGYASVMDHEELQRTLETFQPSPEANRLLKRFLDLVLE